MFIIQTNNESEFDSQQRTSYGWGIWLEMDFTLSFIYFIFTILTPTNNPSFQQTTAPITVSPTMNPVRSTPVGFAWGNYNQLCGHKINIESLTNHLNAEGRLSLSDAKCLIAKTGQLFKKEPNLLTLRDPITVCGDVHGQFFDLLRFLEAGGDPSTTQYLSSRVKLALYWSYIHFISQH